MGATENPTAARSPQSPNFPTALLLNGASIVLLSILAVPRFFERLFADFGTELPPPTKSLMNISRWMNGRFELDQAIPGVYFMVLAFGVIAAIVLGTKLRDSKARTSTPASRTPFWILVVLLAVETTVLIAVLITLPEEFIRWFTFYAAHLPTLLWAALFAFYAAGWIDNPNLVGPRAEGGIWIALGVITGFLAIAIMAPALKLIHALT